MENLEQSKNQVELANIQHHIKELYEITEDYKALDSLSKANIVLFKEKISNEISKILDKCSKIQEDLLTKLK